MKILTWNAAMAFRRKIEYVLPFNADILVIPECEAPQKWGNSKYLESISQFEWFGENQNKGIGVITLNDSYRIEVHPTYCDKIQYIIPLVVSGKEEFTLLAVWSQKTATTYESYIGQIYLALQHYESLLKTPCFIIGDWNSNKIFDHIKRVGNHTEVVDILAKHDITSLYHQYFKEQHGEETKPTHYFRKEFASPFHIDFAFASQNFVNRLTKVEVGTYDKWIKHSDHIPIFLEIEK
ncbi:endonuclease/exonuclease/phosphatase family protein [Bacillus luteolus]|uniref:Endonuclease/exonuclease/phosphatase family protein n=1 Tax=Litchfieldia luteola TaxID=682179 RepID=A0ABR9QL79_9BACI|nr:endonuclease/exonuclease/phosphatase family protein [Cytobacillus luteolus]MBE4909204.1 endonuclease/exonuclease/phosphatase family protein [Cytobacillus luteolus]MBP1940342.1 exonuclease III [Cytobacillus luteolus]